INVIALSAKAKVQVMRGEIEAARATFETLERLRVRMGRMPPFYTAALLRSRLLLELDEIEAATAGGDGDSARKSFRAARRTAYRAASSAAKVAWYRPEVFRLAGRLHWLGGHPRRAFRWWERALREGTRLGTRPELGRTHLAIGRALGASGSAGTPLAGRTAREHLDAAREIFLDLDLATD